MALLEELISLNGLGMLLIVVSWVFQILPMLKKQMSIRKEFVLLQAIGIIMIVVGLMQTSMVVAVLNIASALGALCVLVLLLKK
jgi:hypothetical protein